MTRDDVLQRRGDEEIFLPQPQFLAGRRLVARIEKFRDRFGARGLRRCARIVAVVEGLELQRLNRPRRPKPQCIDVRTAPADDRRVERCGLHRLARNPVDVIALRRGVMFDMAAEMNVIGYLEALELTRIAADKRAIGEFLLPAMRDRLTEQAVLEADAGAGGGA